MHCPTDLAAPKSGPSTPSSRSTDSRHATEPLRADRLWQRLRALRQCTLTTRTPYGELHSRSQRLQNRSLDDGEPLWFFIERGSDLVLDVHADPQVELAFVDRDGSVIRIVGKASVVSAPDAAAFATRHGDWRLPAWQQRDDAQRLTLLRVDMQRVRQTDPPRMPARTPQRELSLA